jgi:Cu2+-exporting ATPase
LHTILRWVALFLTTPIVFYSCAPFFKGAMRDLRTRHLTMDVSVSLAIGGAYIAGIWTSITGVGELYFDAVGMFALFLLAGRYLERRARERTAAATAQLVNLLPASCLRLDATGRANASCSANCAWATACWCARRGIAGRRQDPRRPVQHRRIAADRRIPAATAPGGRCGHGGTLNVEGADRRSPALGQDTRCRPSSCWSAPRPKNRAWRKSPTAPRNGSCCSRCSPPRHRPAVVATGCVAGVLDRPGDAGGDLPVRPVAGHADRPHRRHRHPAQLGLLVTRGHVLEGLNQIDTVIFDKTGTLTEGRLALRAIRPLGALDSDRAWPWPPPGKPLRTPDRPRLRPRPLAAEDVHSTPGLGLEGRSASACCASASHLRLRPQRRPPRLPDEAGQWLLLGDRHGPLAWFVLDDRLRDDAPALLAACKARGWRTLLLSGDSSPMVASVAAELGIDEARRPAPGRQAAGAATAAQEGRKVLMLGDGSTTCRCWPPPTSAWPWAAPPTWPRPAPTRAAVQPPRRTGAGLHLARRTRRVIIENLLWAGCTMASCCRSPPSAGSPGVGRGRHVDQFADRGAQRPAPDSPAECAGHRAPETARCRPEPRGHGVRCQLFT